MKVRYKVIEIESAFIEVDDDGAHVVQNPMVTTDDTRTKNYKKIVRDRFPGHENEELVILSTVKLTKEVKVSFTMLEQIAESIVYIDEE